MVCANRNSTVPIAVTAIPVIVNAIGELPVGGRPPFETIGTMTGEGKGLGVIVGDGVGMGIEVGIGVEVGRIVGVGVAEGVAVGVGISAA